METTLTLGTVAVIVSQSIHILAMQNNLTTQDIILAYEKGDARVVAQVDALIYRGIRAGDVCPK